MRVLVYLEPHLGLALSWPGHSTLLISLKLRAMPQALVSRRVVIERIPRYAPGSRETFNSTGTHGEQGPRDQWSVEFL